jgi:uncharacterized protein (TIGR01777 family)
MSSPEINMTNKQIIINGATGLIGQKLCAALSIAGHDITVFTRDIDNGKKILPFIKNFVEWDYRKPHLRKNELDGKDAIIHLAGANVFGKRWSEKYKSIIMESRETATRNLVSTVLELKNKPEAFISSSAVGFYGDQGDQIITEDSPAGNDFLADVCKAWEKEASLVEKSGVRRVSIRTGIVLSIHDGALKKMLIPFRLFLGGQLGNGHQWFPWIHIEDIVRIYLFALDNKNISGAVNGTSPNPVTMNLFAKSLGKTLHRPSVFTVPGFALKLAVGKGAEPILCSQKVIPKKLTNHSFQFRYNHLEPALASLLVK